MKTRQHITHSGGSGDYNDGPVNPHDTETERSYPNRGCLTGIVMSIALALIVFSFASAYLFVPWWVESQAEHYIPFTNQVTAGTITSSRSIEVNTSKVYLSTSQDSTALKDEKPYLLRCKIWRLHADILTTPSWINTPVHSWYQLTYIEGSQCFDQGGNPVPYAHSKITGSDDGFGESVLKGLGFGLVSAKEITSSFVPVDGKIYSVIFTQNTLSLEATH